MAFSPGTLNPHGQNPLNLFIPIREPVREHYKALVHIVAELKADSMNLVGTVHFASFVFMNEVTNDGEPYFTHLFFNTAFDGDIQTYVQQFVSKLADEFDAMLVHVAVPDGVIPVRKNAHAFQKYLESVNLPTAQWYGNYPGVSAVQIRAYADAAGQTGL
ncbi:MAG: hypothetical protein H7062_21630 [Candidatus Saccharimonas sp.]|nr:hypothetical protein [Planctomycetaceae bacterium]